MAIIRAQRKTFQQQAKRALQFLLNSRRARGCIFYVSAFFVAGFFAFSGVFAFCADKNDERIKFLTSIKTMKADFLQKQYDGNHVEIAHGSITVKKPSSIALTHEGKDAKLKIVSINGNVKVFDENIGQTTYIDNSYNELVRFFTDNLKSEQIVSIGKDIACLPFESLGAEQIACLKIDLQQRLIKGLSIYMLQPLRPGERRKNYTLNQKVADVFFKNMELNAPVDDSVFDIKDSRIFDDEN